MTAALRRPGVGRAAAVLACFRCAELGSWIGITTIAYERGGVRLAAVAVAAQLAPAAVVALGVGSSARRWGTGRVLVGGLAAQSAALLGIAVLIATGAPAPAVLLVAVAASVAVVTTRPTVHATVPLLVDDGPDLLVVNSALGWVDGVAALTGPAVTAVGFSVAGRASPFLVFSALTGLAAVLALPLVAAGAAAGPAAVAEAPDRTGTRLGTAERVLVVVAAAQAFMTGALDILVVVVAVDVTGGGPARAAWLGAAFGAGGVLGAAATASAVAVRRLWTVVAAAGACSAVAVGLVGAVRGPWQAAAALVACGTASAVTVVAARTMLQRCGDVSARCGAFSVVESAETVMLLAGSLAVPLLVTVLGPRWSLVAVGVIVLATALATAGPLAAAAGGGAQPAAVRGARGGT